MDVSSFHRSASQACVPEAQMFCGGGETKIDSPKWAIEGEGTKVLRGEGRVNADGCDAGYQSHSTLDFPLFAGLRPQSAWHGNILAVRLRRQIPAGRLDWL